MTKGIAGRRQAPKPVTQMARRLEAVRERAGIPSLRAFHAKLVEGRREEDGREFVEGWKDKDGRVSYEAVRNYHYDREAPVAYLVRVAKVFGVRLPYLVANDGAMTNEEEQAATDAEGVATAVVAGGANHLIRSINEELGTKYWQEAIELRDSVLAGWARAGGMIAMHPRYMPYWVSPLAAVCQRLKLDPTHVGEVLLAPLRALGIDPVEMNRNRGEALSSYIISMVPVLMALAPELDRERTAAEEGRQHDQQSDE